MTAAAIIAVVAAVAAGAAAAATFVALSRARKRTRTIEREIEKAKAQFVEVVTLEAEERASELEQTLQMSRSESLSLLVQEERRIAEERRRDVVERERDANTKLTTALAAAQRSVEQRFADWGADLQQLQQGIAAEIERLGQRQRQLTAGIETNMTKETDRLKDAVDEHRMLVARLREEFEKSTEEVAHAAAADLESHGAERRRSLAEVADRLRRREKELHEQIERQHAEAAERVTAQLEDIERRQVEHVKRVVAREAQHASEAAGIQFDAVLKTAREESARRLARELDLAVERFVRQAEGVLAERVQAELRVVEARLQEINRRLDSQTARS